MIGFDIAQPLDNGHIAKLKAAGYGFVAGYFSYNPRKNLTRSECAALSPAGIAIVSVFEAMGDRYTSFDARHGLNDAEQALRLAAQVGQPEGSGIYFAVDFDATAAEVAGGVAAYFAAVKQGLAGKYRIGAYGSGAVLTALRNNPAELLWLADAGGWRGTKGFTGWHIKQGLPSRVLGLSVDPDTAVDGDFGQWSLPRQDVVEPAALVIPSARDMQAALVSAAFLPADAVDGIWGQQSQGALAAYYRLARGV